MRAGSPAGEALCLLRRGGRELDGQQSSWSWNQHSDQGWQLLRRWLSLLCHRARPAPASCGRVLGVLPCAHLPWALCLTSFLGLSDKADAQPGYLDEKELGTQEPKKALETQVQMGAGACPPLVVVPSLGAGQDWDGAGAGVSSPVRGPLPSFARPVAPQPVLPRCCRLPWKEWRARTARREPGRSGRRRQTRTSPPRSSCRKVGVARGVRPHVGSDHVGWLGGRLGAARPRAQEGRPGLGSRGVDLARTSVTHVRAGVLCQALSVLRVGSDGWAWAPRCLRGPAQWPGLGAGSASFRSDRLGFRSLLIASSSPRRAGCSLATGGCVV